jgi:hypothetical protein
MGFRQNVAARWEARMAASGHERRFKRKSRTSALPPIPEHNRVAHRREHRQAIDAASTQHRLSLRRSFMRPSKDSVSIPLYRLLPLSDIRRLPTYSGATGPRRPSVKSSVEILMKSEAFTDRDRAERISTQIFGLSLTAVFVGMLLLNAISY